MPPNVAMVNFASGEISPKIRGRFDRPLYNTGCRKLINFIPETSGPARFRTGTRFIQHTRLNRKALLVPYLYNDASTYMLEFTDQAIRFFKDGSPILNSAKAITGISQANPGVITSNGHGYTSGMEVYVSGVGGMTELNNKFFLVVYINANTYSLTDIDGNAIDTSAFTAYTSGGTTQSVYELTGTLFTEDLLDDIDYAQDANIMYITSGLYPLHSISRVTDTNWTLTIPALTNDPFTTTAGSLSSVTLGTSTYVIASGVGGVYSRITGVVGTTQLNGGFFIFVPVTGLPGSPTHKLLHYPSGAEVDSSAYTAYSSGGTLTNYNDSPVTVGFYEGRLILGGTKAYSPVAGADPAQRTETIFMSRSPDTAGASRYTDFTGGTDASHACFFTLSPSNGKVDSFQWVAGSSRQLLAGTFGGLSRITGSGTDIAIAPDSILARSMVSYGCANIRPVLNGQEVFYVQRGGLILRNVVYDVDADDFVAIDLNSVSDVITRGGITQIAMQNGRPDILWAVRSDGVLLGLTYNGRENVAAWHQHHLGGDGAVSAVATLPRETDSDELWVVVDRTINGRTRRFIEVFADPVEFPDPEDYYTNVSATDDLVWRNEVYRLQSQYVHVDCAFQYDGSSRGVTAAATLTPGAVTGTSVTFTASAPVFTADDVGSQLWKLPLDGTGSGRAIITGFTSSTQVTCRIIRDFDSASAVTAGNWAFAITSVAGLDELEGESIAVVADGAVYSDGVSGSRYPVCTVTDGSITLSYASAFVTAGLHYTGMLATENLELPTANGPSQDKPRNIIELGIRFLASLGAKYGTDLYFMSQIVDHSNRDITDRPPPVFSGIRRVRPLDTWSIDGAEKILYIIQALPLPCTVQYLNIYYEASDG